MYVFPTTYRTEIIISKKKKLYVFFTHRTEIIISFGLASEVQILEFTYS